MIIIDADTYGNYSHSGNKIHETQCRTPLLVCFETFKRLKRHKFLIPCIVLRSTEINPKFKTGGPPNSSIVAAALADSHNPPALFIAENSSQGISGKSTTKCSSQSSARPGQTWGDMMMIFLILHFHGGPCTEYTYFNLG